MIAAALLLLLPAASHPALVPAQQGGSLEALEARLAARTAAKREAAAKVWAEHGQDYLRQPSKATMGPLEAVAPEIQDPLFAALSERLAQQPQPMTDIDSLLFLLQQVVDAGGAARLIEMLPHLPSARRPEVLRHAVERGSARTVSAVRPYLDAEDAALRQAALEALLLHDDIDNLPDLAPRIDLTTLDAELFSLTLEELAQRELPASFRLPAALWQAQDPQLQAALTLFLAAHPQDDSEDFLIARSLDENISLQQRQAALDAYVAGAKAFRWKAGARDFERYLKDHGRSKTCEAIAWALHHLGERRGRRYLLEEPEAAAKRNPDDWQLQLALGRMQVEVSEFADGYRTFKRTFDSIDNTPIARRLQAIDFLYAARAAAGSGHRREAGEWLQASRLSREELAPYRDLPEFADVLKKEPFASLFPPAEE